MISEDRLDATGRGGVPPGPGGLMAETLGRAMARRAADALARRRGPAGDPEPDPEQDAADNAVFEAVLGAANECLGRVDGRPAADRWCDALLQVLSLAESDLPR